MAEKYRFFGGAEGDERNYNQTEMAEVYQRFFRNGYFPDVDSGLQITATDPLAMAVLVSSGQAWIQGYWYKNDTEKILSISPAHTSLNRIDRIVLRLDVVNTRLIVAEVKQGIPASNPEPPSLIRTTQTYEISLAQVYVQAGVTSISQEDIFDERDNTAVCGHSIPYHAGEKLTKNLNANAKKVINLADPTADNDAVNKKYADTKVPNTDVVTAAQPNKILKLDGLGILPATSANANNLGGRSASYYCSHADIDRVFYNITKMEMDLYYRGLLSRSDMLNAKAFIFDTLIDATFIDESQTVAEKNYYPQGGFLNMTLDPVYFKPWELYGHWSMDGEGDAWEATSRMPGDWMKVWNSGNPSDPQKYGMRVKMDSAYYITNLQCTAHSVRLGNVQIWITSNADGVNGYVNVYNGSGGSININPNMNAQYIWIYANGDPGSTSAYECLYVDSLRTTTSYPYPLKKMTTKNFDAGFNYSRIKVLLIVSNLNTGNYQTKISKDNGLSFNAMTFVASRSWGKDSRYTELEFSIDYGSSEYSTFKLQVNPLVGNNAGALHSYAIYTLD